MLDLDPDSLSEYSSHILKHSADLALENTAAASEISQRLGLYQVFLKLYEHHRTLLNDILDLENTSERARAKMAMQFVQGLVRGPQVTLVSNLREGLTTSLFQAQRIWLIGRDRDAAICLQDTRLSRRHAAVQYIDNEGFYLVDLNSTNGTYVNGEPVRRAVLLQDGDQVRLGSLGFTFFLCQNSEAVDSVPTDVLDQINTHRQGCDVDRVEPTYEKDTAVRSGGSLQSSL
jgi:pSer/pThr/pTyr-binding forkhead associated (FHA) protein